MDLSLVSDLHIDVGGLPVLPGGGTLLVAGDTAEAHMYDKVSMQTMFEKYERVYMVMGNHEHYKCLFQNTRIVCEAALPENTSLLEKEVRELGPGLKLFAASMWTNMGKDKGLHFQIRERVRQYMSDFHVIGYVDPVTHRPRKFDPDDAVIEFETTIERLEKALLEYPDDKFVVMTHHAPSFQSVPPEFRTVQHEYPNHGYATELSEFLRIHEGRIPLWVHGHMHSKSDYMIYGTRVVCNPRGYVGYERCNSDFNPGLILTV